MKYIEHNLDGTITITGEDDAPIVPSTITKVQAMKQMKFESLWVGFKTFINEEVNEEANDEWMLATELQREHEFTLAFGMVVNKTSAEIDTFFIEASGR